MRNEYQLQKGRDDWFLRQNRKDPYLNQVFKAGDWVVVCGECKRVWLRDNWEYHKKCPQKDCPCKKTIHFSRRALTLKSTGRIAIISSNVAADGSVEERDIARYWLKKIAEGIGKCFFRAKAIDWLLDVLLVVVVMITLVLNLADLSGSDFPARAYYRAKYELAANQLLLSVKWFPAMLIGTGQQLWAQVGGLVGNGKTAGLRFLTLLKDQSLNALLLLRTDLLRTITALKTWL